jgi:hypothetical protein
MNIEEIRQRCREWRKRHPMFAHDIRRLEQSIEKHISNYSSHLVMYRQTHKQSYLQKAEQEIEEIQKLITFIEKIELMSLLSRR